MNRFDEQEVDAIAQVIRSGKLSPFFRDFRGGEQVQAFEHDFAKYIGIKHAVSVCNGTVSLEIALKAIDVGKSWEVITTPLSFIATGTAILSVGATPVFVDINRKTLNIDPKKIEDAITEDTRAIIPVDLLGYPCQIDRIMHIAHGHKHSRKILVVQDAAQALGASYKKATVGAHADVASYSLQESKTITSGGEGGMIVTNDDVIAEKCRNIRNHGNVYGGDPEIICGNYRMTEMQAAFGRVQLKKLNHFNYIQKNNALYFLSHLPSCLAAVWPGTGYPTCCPSYYLIPTILSTDRITRDEFVKKMTDMGISQGLPGQNVGYYKKLIYDNPIFYTFNDFGTTPKKWDCPNAEWARDNLILWDIHRFYHTLEDTKKTITEIGKALET